MAATDRRPSHGGSVNNHNGHFAGMPEVGPCDAMPGHAGVESSAEVSEASATPEINQDGRVDEHKPEQETGSADDSRIHERPQTVGLAPPPLVEVESKRYTIQSEHARGGLGRILIAQDRRLDRPVAVKELLGAGDDAEARF